MLRSPSKDGLFFFSAGPFLEHNSFLIS